MEFLEGICLQGGHVKSVTVGETSWDSNTMNGWFSLEGVCGGYVFVGGYKLFCRVFHIVEHLLSFDSQYNNANPLKQVRNLWHRSDKSAQRKGVWITRKERCLHAEKAKASNSL